MAKFSKRSRKNLNEAHPLLQILFEEVIKHYDCTILDGHRPKHEQDEAFRKGHSKLKWPRSKHNKFPSLAVDVAPYPIDWNDADRFYHFGGFVLGVARMMGIPIRWGGDWNRNNNLKDQSFFDWPHFELHGKLKDIEVKLT